MKVGGKQEFKGQEGLKAESRKAGREAANKKLKYIGREGRDGEAGYEKREENSLKKESSNKGERHHHRQARHDSKTTIKHTADQYMYRTYS